MLYNIIDEVARDSFAFLLEPDTNVAIHVSEHSGWPHDCVVSGRGALQGVYDSEGAAHTTGDERHEKRCKMVDRPRPAERVAGHLWRLRQQTLRSR